MLLIPNHCAPKPPRTHPTPFPYFFDPVSQGLLLIVLVCSDSIFAPFCQLGFKLVPFIDFGSILIHCGFHSGTLLMNIRFPQISSLGNHFRQLGRAGLARMGISFDEHVIF